MVTSSADLPVIVLGGWALAPDILRSLFGDRSVFIDINPFMPELVEHERLRQDWKKRFANALEQYLDTKPIILAGWSTGAIIALACAGLLECAGLILVSATASFCRTPQWHHGMRSSVLQAMRKKLLSEPETVIADFAMQCGIDNNTPVPSRTAHELICGLHFLEQASLSFEGPPGFKPLFIHGKKDAIVPCAASTALQSALGGTTLFIDAPHACFINNETVVISAINTYLKGCQHG